MRRQERRRLPHLFRGFGASFDRSFSPGLDPYSTGPLSPSTHKRKEQDMRRVALLIIALAIAAAIPPSSAAAGKPEKFSFDFTTSATVTTFCPFPVDITSSVQGHEVDFFDESGALVSAITHITEQDTFSANGKTLVGDPFRFNILWSFEGDDAVGIVALGVAEKVRLPDAKLFLSAGVLDFLAQGVDFSLRTDPGRTGDIDAFCAALSP
jgi:hypothetical protein